MKNITEIMNIIPHRYPFLLVDRIIEIDEENQKVKGIKNVTINEQFFSGHFPGHPIMPGVLIIEGMAQCLGVFIMEKEENKIPYFASIENAKFKQPVVPGDTLVYEVEVIKRKRNVIKAQGKVFVGDKLVAESSFTFCAVEK